ncbi:MAG: cation diffusion facilitator family transporter [Pseudomonadota bacterium]
MHSSHNHIIPSTNKAFLLAASINIIFVIVEIIYGFLANSLALLADAGHNFIDVLTLLLAWGANTLAGIKPSARRTYGYRRTTILAALFSSIALMVTILLITIEAILRLHNSIEPHSLTIVFVATVGVAVNFLTAALFLRDKNKDLNVKGAFLHLFADGMVSLAVVLGGLIIYFTGWSIVDPILSVLIVITIAFSSWELLRDSFNLSIDAVPRNIDVDDVRKYLLSLPDVTSIHDLHIWATSTTHVAMTAHILRNVEYIDDDFLNKTTQELNDRFGIHHSTLQIENGDCKLNC